MFFRLLILFHFLVWPVDACLQFKHSYPHLYELVDCTLKLLLVVQHGMCVRHFMLTYEFNERVYNVGSSSGKLQNSQVISI